MANTGPSELILGLLLLLGIATLLGLFLAVSDAPRPEAREAHRSPPPFIETVPPAPPSQSGLTGV